jgi:hypothetical protein
MVKIDEGGTDQKYSERLHQILTTFFETDFKLWGNDSTGWFFGCICICIIAVYSKLYISLFSSSMG